MRSSTALTFISAPEGITPSHPLKTSYSYTTSVFFIQVVSGVESVRSRPRAHEKLVAFERPACDNIIHHLLIKTIGYAS